VSRNLLVAACSIVLVAASAACGGSKENDPSTALQGNSPHPIAGKFVPDDRKLSDCNGDRLCVEQAYGNISYNDGPKAAMALIRHRQNTTQVKADCHRIVHTIGSAALERYDGNVAKAFSEGDSTCWSGYYHGILEKAFLGAASTKELASRARSVCDDSGIRSTAWLAYQCVHGLGHGLMIDTGYNLPLSLRICDRLATNWDQTSCTGGVFMENISSSYGFKSPWLRKNDLVYPCDAVKERHKLYCYLMVTSRILQANGYDWKAAARTCARVEQGWVATCFQSFGRDASGFTRQDPPQIMRLCRIAGNGENDCVYGAARDLTANDANGKRAARLCEIAPGAVQARCFSGIGTILGGFSASSDAHRAACSALTRAFLQPCLRGAGVAS
jgi:hypothetical protein